MKRILILLTCCLAFVGTLFAQQNPDVETWRKEYEKRFADTVKQRTEHKPNFAKDVLFSKPDYVVFVPSVEPEKLGDTYNDHFQVFDKPNGMLFALWCQATVEGALDQHVAFSRSKDKGKTWEPPRVLAGNRTVAEGIANGGAIASWAFPMVSRSGRIYILYNQFIPGKVSTHRQHTGIMMGIFSDDDGETWTKPVEIATPRTSNDKSDKAVPPEWVVWQKPLRQGKSGNYIVGVTRYVAPEFHAKYRTVTEFLHFDNLDSDPKIENLVVRWVMTDEKVLHRGVHCEEPAIVKLPDGRLFCVMRSGIGSPCWTLSEDHGETWTKPQPLLTKDGGDPIHHPMSPCPIYDWRGNEAGSGLYFLLAHNRFDYNNTNPWQNRGPLYLFPGRYQKDARQPVWFDGPKKFIDRPGGNSFYTSLTVMDGKTVLWYPDQKFYLLGRVIGEDFFDGKSDTELYQPGVLEPARILKPVPPEFGDDQRLFQGIPSLALSPGGRLWANWYTGGDNEGEENYVLVSSSGDSGKTWSKPLFAIDIPGPVRAYDPEIWTDPDGKTWIFWAQSKRLWDGRSGVWCIVSENADQENASWSKPRRLCDGIMMCKPLVDSKGRWLLPVSIWTRDPVEPNKTLPAGANVIVSKDKGKTWKYLGHTCVPLEDAIFDEHNLVERKDGSLWMLIRTKAGIRESVSSDGGKTWSDPVLTDWKHPSARFFVRRLQSGKLILVKHGNIGEQTGRSHLRAFLSDDDGKTWQGGLLLDERNGVSYPDGDQGKDGTIFLIYDFDRYGAKEILSARITEEDILAGKIVNENSALRVIVNKSTAQKKK